MESLKLSGASPAQDLFSELWLVLLMDQIPLIHCLKIMQCPGVPAQMNTNDDIDPEPVPTSPQALAKLFFA